MRHGADRACSSPASAWRSARGSVRVHRQGPQRRQRSRSTCANDATRPAGRARCSPRLQAAEGRRADRDASSTSRRTRRWSACASGWAENSPILDLALGNPLPASFEVKAAGSRPDGRRSRPTSRGTKGLQADRQGAAEPRLRRQDRPTGCCSTARTIEAGDRRPRACVLTIAAVLLIGNTIRLSIFARRREVEVMKLVGATNWFVRWPFMLEGMICGLVGSVLARRAAAGLVPVAAGEPLRGRLPTTSDVGALDFQVLALILLSRASRSARPAPASRCAASCASEPAARRPPSSVAARVAPARAPAAGEPEVERPEIVACEVVRRGRFLVGGAVLRRPGCRWRSAGAARSTREPGELVLVEPSPRSNRARVVERLGSPQDVEVAARGAGRRGRRAAAVSRTTSLAEVELAAGATRRRRRAIAATCATAWRSPSTRARAKDHDDALTVETEGDGWRVLVHIADVAASVRPGLGARPRGASARVLGLPAGARRADAAAGLSSGLCSLVPDRPRDTRDGRAARSRPTAAIVGRPRSPAAQIVSAPALRVRRGGAGPRRATSRCRTSCSRRCARSTGWRRSCASGAAPAGR